MKLSNNTLAILTNFSTINSNILFRPGNVLRTISVAGDVSAHATVSEEFPSEFAIYDLPQFLKGIKLYDNPELEILDKEGYILIRHGNHTIKYFITEPDLVVAPQNKGFKLPSEDVSFQMTEEHFDKLLKATSVFGLSDFTVLGQEGHIYLQVRNKSNPTSNQVSILVGESESEFEFNFDKNNILMIDGSYEVTISKEMLARFTNRDFDLTYFVGLCSDSYFNS